MLLKDLEALLSGLFAIAYSGECTENEYAMRCEYCSRISTPPRN